MKTLTDDDLALTGGDFRLDPFRRIQVWVPATTTEPSCAFDDPPPPSKPQKDTRTRRTVPCPECGCDKSLAALRCQRCAAIARSTRHGVAA